MQLDEHGIVGKKSAIWQLEMFPLYTFSHARDSPVSFVWSKVDIEYPAED